MPTDISAGVARNVVSPCVCVLGTTVNCAKVAELIMSRFKGRLNVNHTRDGVHMGATW